MNSAMKPLRPGSPKDANPAMTKKKLVTRIRVNSPFKTLMSRMCARSYTVPTKRNIRAVMIPWENICSTAPPTPMGSSVAMPMST